LQVVATYILESLFWHNLEEVDGDSSYVLIGDFDAAAT